MPNSTGELFDSRPQMRQKSKGYAMNEDNAEKARSRSDGSSAATPIAGKTGPGAGGEAGGGTKPNDKEAHSGDPEPNAEIWSLYLTEAEEKAKHQEELWRTGLDSLLLFAGLFAGIVASFVIDSRRNLQPDPQQVLLTDIRNALRSEAAPQDTFIPSTSSLWINGLWFASLLITLFSAIIGVLAKAWLANFIPVTDKKESDDAYKRWVRDKKAKSWYLENVIKAAPLLIQLALFLFLLGFGIQSVGDNPTLGWIVLGSLFSATTMYTVVTVLPIFIPWCPFQTPLSDVLSDITLSILLPNSATSDPKDGTRTHLSWRDGPKKDEVLGEIWCEMFNSKRPSNIDAAIAGLTQEGLDTIWWERFVQRRIPDVVSLVCQRLGKLITYGAQLESRYDVLCNHLRVVLGFVDYFENSEPTKPSEKLKEFLVHGNPLHRWNVFPERIRALAFSVRTPILLACKEDYTASEMEERPWETMVHDMPPADRGDFALAACRGLVGNQERLRKVSALSIVMCIAKATTTIGPESEWVQVDDKAKKETKDLGQLYLGKLFEEIAKGWKTMVLDHLKKTTSVAVNADSRDIIMPGSLSSELKHPTPEVRTRTITMLLTLAEDAELIDAVKPPMPELVELAVNDPDQGVRAGGMKALISLAREKKLRKSIKKVLPDSLESALKALDSRDRAHGIDTLLLLVRNRNFQGTVDSLLPQLAEMTVKDEDVSIRIDGMKALTSLAQDEKLRRSIKKVLPDSLKSALKASDSRDRARGASALMLLVQNRYFHDAVDESVISELTEMTVNDENKDACDAGVGALMSLAQDENLRDTIKLLLPASLKSAFQQDSGKIRVRAMDRLVMLVQDFKFQSVVQPAIPELIEKVLGYEDDDSRIAGAKTLATLVQDNNLRNTITLVLPKVLGIEWKGVDSRTRASWIEILLMLAQNNDFRDSIETAIPTLLGMMMSDVNVEVQEAGMKALTSLAEDASLRGAIKLTLAQVLQSVLTDSNCESRICALNTLVPLLKDANFREAVEEAVPKLVEIVMNDNDDNVRAAGMKSLVSLAQGDDVIKQLLPESLASKFKDPNWQGRIHVLDTLRQNSDFRDAVQSAIPNLIQKAVDDGDADVRMAGVKTMSSIVGDYKPQDIIKPVVLNILDSKMDDRDWRVRAAWLEMLVTLAQLPYFQSSAKSSIRNVVNMAMIDENTDVRVAEMDSAVTLAQVDKFSSAMKQDRMKMINSTLNGSNSQLCIAWAKMHGALAQNPDFHTIAVESGIPGLVEMAVGGGDEAVRVAGVKSLVALIRHDKLRAISSIAQDSVKSSLPKSLDLALKNADWQVRTAWMEILTDLAENSGHRKYIQSAIPNVIEIAVDEKDYNVRRAGVKALIYLAPNDKFQDTIIRTLLESFESAFNASGFGGWSQILDALTHCTSLRDFSGYTKLPTLEHVEAAVRGDEDAVSVTMAGLFAFLMQKDEVRNISKSALSKNLDSALKDPELQRRRHAITALSALTPYSHFRDTVKSAIPQLLKMAVNDEDEDMRAAKVVLNNLRTGGKNKSNFGDAIFLAVPSAIALVTPEGRDIQKAIDVLMEFCGAPKDGEPTAISMEHILTPMLKESLWLTRATGAEFVAVLIKYKTFRRFIQPVIPEVITLALEDKEDDVRAAGIRSLVKLVEYEDFRGKIKTIQPQLMPLLEVYRLRAPVAELISLLAVDKIVRKDVVSSIIDPLTTLKTGAYPDGFLELLWRLIVDKRFIYQETSDFVMLSVTSVLLMRPQTAYYRFQTAIALWCNYGNTDVSPECAEFQEHLVKLFIPILFGRHVTKDEVKKWQSMSSHLSQNQVE